MDCMRSRATTAPPSESENKSPPPSSGGVAFTVHAHGHIARERYAEPRQRQLRLPVIVRELVLVKGTPSHLPSRGVARVEFALECTRAQRAKEAHVALLEALDDGGGHGSGVGGGCSGGG